MMKRIIAIAVVLCLICCVFVGCKKNISAKEAFEIVLQDLGKTANSVSTPHIHEGMFDTTPCYNIYVTVGEENWYYIVTVEGEIVNEALLDEAHKH